MDGIGRNCSATRTSPGCCRTRVSAIPQAVEYVAQVVAEKNATLVSLTDDADLLVAGMTEQVPAANVAEYHRIPLAALHFFPSQILQPGSPQGGATTTLTAPSARRSACRTNPEPASDRWRSRRTRALRARVGGPMGG